MRATWKLVEYIYFQIVSHVLTILHFRVHWATFNLDGPEDNHNLPHSRYKYFDQGIVS